MFTTNTFNYKCLNYLFYKQVPAKKTKKKSKYYKQFSFNFIFNTRHFKN